MCLAQRRQRRTPPASHDVPRVIDAPFRHNHTLPRSGSQPTRAGLRICSTPQTFLRIILIILHAETRLTSQRHMPSTAIAATSRHNRVRSCDRYPRSVVAAVLVPQCSHTAFPKRNTKGLSPTLFPDIPSLASTSFFNRPITLHISSPLIPN